MAMKLRIDLRDLLVGRWGALPVSLSSPSAVLEARSRSAPEADVKRAHLQQWLQGQRDASIREMAADLSMSHRDVYHYAGDEARAHSEARRGKAEEERNDELESARSAASGLLMSASSAEMTLKQLRDTLADAFPNLSYTTLLSIVQRAWSEATSRSTEQAEEASETEAPRSSEIESEPG
jgi:hypothetical protein